METVVLLTKEAPKKGNFIGEVSGEKRDIDTAFGIQQKVLEEINTLAEKYKIDKVILFGSRARGDYKEVSDIDLAVSGGDVNEFTLAVDAETSTLLEYDVVNLDGSVQEELRKSIEREGKMLYEKI
ncbi:nucleotidyltransferase family protein [Cuneatibacter caecimuris]|uniref:nucleotidyltransferase family protein n=1 Tax=Cuneatibacter caecimuris TaxID=1796618 RepID=UPI001FB1D2C5|nr:nucleotidyltransferase domain-containing protein [Cuneatibacter caecimuris]